MENVIEIGRIDATEQVESANKVVANFEEVASRCVLKTQADYDLTIGNIRQIEIFKRNLEEKRVSITKPIDQAKKAVMDLFRPAVTKCDEISQLLRGKVADFETKLRLEREEAQRKLDAEAEKKRKEAEAKAEKLRAEGREAMAAKQEAKAENIVAPIVQPKLQAVAGTAQVTYWHARVVDVNKVPRAWLVVDEAALEKYAKATQGKIPIDGVEFFSETKTTIRR